LPVTTTTIIVTTGCASAIQRHLLVDATTMVMPMIAAHATCTDGIAESWAGPDLPKAG
jgi:hypothetical protein